MKLPLTLRLAFHGFRAATQAGFLFICAWLAFIPANINEQNALGAEPGTQFPEGLRPMRAARVIVAVTPESAYQLIATVGGRGLSPLMVQVVLLQIATGRVQVQATTDPAQTTDSARDIDINGPRFIQVD